MGRLFLSFYEIECDLIRFTFMDILLFTAIITSDYLYTLEQ